VFYPSSQWSAGIGPIEPYVLAGLYAWLEAHSEISHPYVAASASLHQEEIQVLLVVDDNLDSDEYLRVLLQINLLCM